MDIPLQGDDPAVAKRCGPREEPGWVDEVERSRLSGTAAVTQGCAPLAPRNDAAAVGLLDALGLESAHLVGASMGGAIAQTVAIEHPQRVRSLTSIMSSTGDVSVGQPDPEAGRPAPADRLAAG